MTERQYSALQAEIREMQADCLAMDIENGRY